MDARVAQRTTFSVQDANSIDERFEKLDINRDHYLSAKELEPLNKLSINN